MSSAPLLHSNSIVQRVPHIEFVALDEDWLALDSESGYCYSLNEVAGRVWALIAHPTPVAVVCDQLRPHYVVDEATCKRDVLELLQQLIEVGLAQIVEAQG